MASQLSNQLNVEKVHAKSLWIARINLKTQILTYNIMHYINIFIGKDINFSRFKQLYLNTLESPNYY